MKSFAKNLDTRSTPQSKPIPGREDRMVKNEAGAYGFSVGDFERASRFLILGTDSGTFYANQNKLTKESVGSLLRAYDADPDRMVHEIIRVSQKGLSLQNDYALFALAAILGHLSKQTDRASQEKRDPGCGSHRHPSVQLPELSEVDQGPWHRSS